jgi:hypothetical protein
MAALRAILEIFGTLDIAAERSENPEVRAAVAALIPGDPDNTGWFAELDAFMFPGGDRTQLGRSADPPRTEADLNLALQDATDPTRNADEPLSVPELARLIYGIGAATRVESIAPGSIQGFAAAYDGDGTLTEAPVVTAFRLAAPQATSTSGPSGPPRDPREGLGDVRALFAASFTGYDQWQDVATNLVEQGLVDPRIAHNLLEGASVVSIKGIKSLVVDTQFDTDDATLNQVKAVADPRNWHYNYPAFFCDMEGKGPRSDTWRQVLETVGAAEVPYSRRLRTNLKFFKRELNDAPNGDCWAHLDYDLNDPVPDPLGDGQIDVDRGYINMRAKAAPDGTVDPDKKGVTIRTRKVAHIKGIRPETQARFCLVFGYTAGALDMLIGPATDPNRDVSKYYPWADVNDKPRKVVPPPPSTNSVASTAFKMAVSYSEDLMVTNLDLTDKWLSGQLSLKDLADSSSEFGARLASDPWKFLQAIIPPKKGGGT